MSDNSSYTSCDASDMIGSESYMEHDTSSQSYNHTLSSTSYYTSSPHSNSIENQSCTDNSSYDKSLLSSSTSRIPHISSSSLSSSTPHHIHPIEPPRIPSVRAIQSSLSSSKLKPTLSHSNSHTNNRLSPLDVSLMSVDVPLHRLRSNEMLVKMITPKHLHHINSLSDVMPSNVTQGITTAKISSPLHHNRSQQQLVKDSPFVSPKYAGMLNHSMRSNPTSSSRYNSNKSSYVSFTSPKTSATSSSAGGISSSTLDKLFKEVEKGLSLQVLQMKKGLHASLEKLDRRLQQAERNISHMVDRVITNRDDELAFADNLVHKELRSKIMMSQWTSAFIADIDHSNGKEQQLDPVTFAYARFALNISLSYNDVQPEYFIRSKVHEQLITYLSFSSEMVVGPALMALTHLSLHSIMKPIIASSSISIFHPLLQVLASSSSAMILSQACKLIASLALHEPNKAIIVHSGCFHAVVDMILGTGKRGLGSTIDNPYSKWDQIPVPHAVQYHALAAAVNIIHGSDSNRVLALELKAVYPAIHAMNSAIDDDIIISSADLLANIAYNSAYAGSTIISHGGDQALLIAIQSHSIDHKHVIVSCLSALSNQCSCETNQSHLGGDDMMLEMVIKLMRYVDDVHIIHQAARMIIALAWKHNSNKARLAMHGACTALFYQIMRYHRLGRDDGTSWYDDEDTMTCFEYLNAALSSILLNVWTHHMMDDINGVEEIVSIARVSQHSRVMRAVAMVIVAMVPCPDDLLRYHAEARAVAVEKAAALPVLKKIRVHGFGQQASPPDWLETSIMVMTKTDAALAQSQAWDKREFVDNVVYYSETCTAIQADADIMHDPQLQGFLFSLY